MNAWLSFLGLSAVFSVTPGPAVLLVMGQSLGSGVRAAQGGIWGVLTANLAYSVLSVLGLGAIFLAHPALFDTIRFAGAVFVVWLGIKSLLSTSHTPRNLTAISRSPRALFREAFLLQTANPKSIITFGALLPQFVVPGYSTSLQMLGLAAAANLIEWPILTMYAFAGDRLLRLTGRGRWLQWIGGCTLILVGLTLVLGLRH